MRYIIILLIAVLISSCGSRESTKEVQMDDSLKQEYLQKGGEIATLTQAELLKNVSLAMQKGGPEYAVDFCHLRAMDLKDSLSDLNNCEIRRISQKYRNPGDRPQSESENKLLVHYQKAYEEDVALEAEVLQFKDRIEYYQPITVAMDACLKCHGTPGKHISDETSEVIKHYYPDDLATGYELYDFRGAWKITFKL